MIYKQTPFGSVFFFDDWYKRDAKMTKYLGESGVEELVAEIKKASNHPVYMIDISGVYSTANPNDLTGQIKFSELKEAILNNEIIGVVINRKTSSENWDIDIPIYSSLGKTSEKITLKFEHVEGNSGGKCTRLLYTAEIYPADGEVQTVHFKYAGKLTYE